MSEIQQSGGGGDSKKRAKKQSTRVDMTPLVDLAFTLDFLRIDIYVFQAKGIENDFPREIGKDNPNIKPRKLKMD